MKKNSRTRREKNSDRVGKDKLVKQVKALERELVKPLKKGMWKKIFRLIID